MNQELRLPEIGESTQGRYYENQLLNLAFANRYRPSG